MQYSGQGWYIDTTKDLHRRESAGVTVAFIVPINFPFHRSTPKYIRLATMLRWFRQFKDINYTLQTMDSRDVASPEETARIHPELQLAVWEVVGDKEALRPIIREHFKEHPAVEWIVEDFLKKMARRAWGSADEGETISAEEQAELDREIPPDQIICS